MEWAKSSKKSMSVLQTNVDKGLRTRLKEVLSTAVAFNALWVCVSEFNYLSFIASRCAEQVLKACVDQSWRSREVIPKALVKKEYSIP